MILANKQLLFDNENIERLLNGMSVERICFYIFGTIEQISILALIYITNHYFNSNIYLTSNIINCEHKSKHTI